MFLVLLVNLYTFLIGTSRAVYTALFNLYLKHQHLDNTIIGRSTFYYSWGLAIGGFIFASLSDKIGRKKTILLTLPMYVLFGLSRIYEPSHTFLLYFFSFLFGFFDTSVILPAISVIESSDEKKRLRNSNINFAIVLLTGVIGYFGAGALAKVFGLGKSLVFSMILALVAALPVFAFPDVRVYRKKRGKEKLTLIQKTMLTYYMLSGALVSLAAGVFINFGNVIFYDLFAFSTTVITGILAISQLSTALTSLFSHKLAAKYGYKLTLFLVYLGVTLLIFAMPLFMLNSTAFSVAYVLRYILINISTPMYMVFCLSYLPKSSLATYSGLNFFLNNVMRAMSAQLFAGLSKGGTTDYNKLFLVSGFFYLVNTLATLLAFYLMYKLSSMDSKISEKSTLQSDQKSDGRESMVVRLRSNGQKKSLTFVPAKRRSNKRSNKSVSVHFHMPPTRDRFNGVRSKRR
jgi:MFS family permease